MQHLIKKQEFLLKIAPGLEPFGVQHAASGFYRDTLLSVLERVFDELSTEEMAVQRTAPSAIARDARKKQRSPIVLVAGAIIVGAAPVCGWLFSTHKAHALTDKDTIVLADFAKRRLALLIDRLRRRTFAIAARQEESILADAIEHRLTALRALIRTGRSAGVFDLFQRAVDQPAQLLGHFGTAEVERPVL